MKALSVIQPWAWLIIHGGKTIENRGWDTRTRGRVLIHASKGMTLDQYDEAASFAFEVGGQALFDRIPAPRDLQRGGIIGAVTLTGVLPPVGKPANPWHMPGCHGFMLGDPEPLPFRPCKGALGFWGHFELRNGLVVSTEVRA